MLNFLTQKNKKQIIFEYLLRVSVFLLLFVFISSLISISMFGPSFFFVKYKNDTLSLQLELVKQKNITDGEDPAALIKSANGLAVALLTNDAATYSDIVKKIVSLKNKNVKISSISITKENEIGDKKIVLSGVANTRDSLTLFNKNIITDGYFSSVSFPVANFIRSTNSEFTATLVYTYK